MSFDSDDDTLNRHYRASSINLMQKINELVDMTVPSTSRDRDNYREMLLSIIRMAQADRNHWDVRLAHQSLLEMEAGFSLLERFKRRRKVTVFGSARIKPEHPCYVQASELGKRLAEHDFMVITGAGGGIMAAAHEGAGPGNCLGFNIKLPFEQYANDVVEGTDYLLSFHYFFIRKLFFVKEAEAVVLCPGGFGTLDEGLELLTLIQTGKTPMVPVILMDVPGSTYWNELLTYFHNQLEGNVFILPSDMHLVRLVHSAEEATQEILGFYANFHSCHWRKHHFVIRMNHPLSEVALEHVQNHFVNLTHHGEFEQVPYEEERFKEREFAKLTYLTFTFNKRDYGRLRELIDFINLPKNWQKE